jgi:protein TonB
MNKLLIPLTATAALLCACAAPPPPPAAAATAPVATMARARPDATTAPRPAGSQKVSLATTAKAYRIDGARHLYATYPDRIFKGKLPPLIHAVVVTETELDARGNVRSVQMVRVPSHAPEVVVKVREMIMAASPLPAPQRMGGTRYTDIWLVDKSGRFQLDTLTEGQL